MLEFLLRNSGLTLQQFQAQFKEFIIDNKLVGTSAGVTIGITTKDLIQSLVGDIIIPFFYLFIFQFGIEKIELLPGKTTFDFTSFIRQFITWILSVVAVFFFVYYFFMSVIGINQKHIQAGSVNIPTTQKPTNQPIAPNTNPTTPTTPRNKINTPTPASTKNYLSSSSSSYGNNNSYNNDTVDIQN